MAEQQLKPRSSVLLSIHQYPAHTPSPKFSHPLHTWKGPLPECGGDRGSWATACNWFKGWPWDLHILNLSMTKFLRCRKLLLPPAPEEVLRNDPTHLATEQKCLRQRPEMAPNPGWHPSIIHAAAQCKVSRWKKKDFQKHHGFNKWVRPPHCSGVSSWDEVWSYMLYLGVFFPIWGMMLS